MGHIRSYPSAMMRAPDSMDYMQFIEALKTMWASASPDIPLVRAYDKEATSYPRIVEYLELRTPDEDVGKPTYQEDIEDKFGNQFQITRMPFKNVINFDVYHDGDPEVADLTMERFEKFFIEAIPFMERLGAKDVQYARRNQDNTGARQDHGVITRSLSVLATIEYVISTPVSRLDAITIEARVSENMHSAIITPHAGIENTTANYRPRYYQYGGANPIFQVAEDELEYLYIPMSNFQSDDILYLAPLHGYEFIGQYPPFYVRVIELDNDPYLFTTRYTVVPYDITNAEDEESTPWSFDEPGKGQVFFVSPRAVNVNLVD